MAIRFSQQGKVTGQVRRKPAEDTPTEARFVPARLEKPAGEVKSSIPKGFRYGLSVDKEQKPNWKKRK